MKCLILAAGKGSRLQQRHSVKPLLPLLGVPLIERGVRSAIEAGIDSFVVVLGHAQEQVREFLQQLARRLQVSIETVINPQWHCSENGRSVLAAEPLLPEPFVLLMADHLVEPVLLRRLLQNTPPEDGLLLAVDRSMDNPLVDLQDVTKVALATADHGYSIRAIGKTLQTFNAYDTGVFYCTPGIFSAIRYCAQAGDSSLSAAVGRLASAGRAVAVDVSGMLWCDIDDPAAYARAQRALLQHARGKSRDGPVSRWLNRPLSISLSRLLVATPVTPNQISLFSFVLSAVAAWLFTCQGYLALVLGGVLAQAASVIDGCDGEVARLKYLRSDYGGWFDAVLDRYADALLLFGLTWHALTQSSAGTAAQLVLVAGFMAIIGSFMLSYTADKYDGMMARRSQAAAWLMPFRLGRDVRVMLVFVGALLNQVEATLWLIAVLMNLETLRRIIVCRESCVK